MGNKYKEVGGGPTVGLANDWTSALKSLLFGGSTPGTQMVNAGNVNANAGGPAGLTNANNGPGGIYNFLQDIISQGGGKLGGNLGSQITRGINEGRSNIGEQFASIGGRYGSGAAQAISKYNAESADAVPLGIANFQMQTIGPLLNYIQGLSEKGITQRQTVAEQNPILQRLTAAGAAAQGISKLIPGVGMASSAIPGVPNAPSNWDLNHLNMPSIPQIDLSQYLRTN